MCELGESQLIILREQSYRLRVSYSVAISKTFIPHCIVLDKNVHWLTIVRVSAIVLISEQCSLSMDIDFTLERAESEISINTHSLASFDLWSSLRFNSGSNIYHLKTFLNKLLK